MGSDNLISEQTAERDDRLIRRYVVAGDEDAFERLVRRHVDMVYAAVLRQVRDAGLAEDVTQAVFVVLHRKADGLQAMPTLAGWLLTVARYAAVDAMRNQAQHKRWDQAAAKREAMKDTPKDTWREIAPVLDVALEKLHAHERDAIVLRFFEDKTFSEVGASLGINEDAARKRVDRGLKKLRAVFQKEGVVLTIAGMTASLAGNPATAAPVRLAADAGAIVRGVTPSPAVLSIAKATLIGMTWAKAQLIGLIGILVLMMGGVGTTAISRLISAQKETQAAPFRQGSELAANAETDERGFLQMVVRDLNDFRMGVDAVMDLDTGRLDRMPSTPQVLNQVDVWLEAMNHNDVMSIIGGGEVGGRVPAGFTGLAAANVQFKAASMHDWNKMTAAGVRATEFGESSPGSTMSLLAAQTFEADPVVVVFRTREGAMGLMQVVEARKDSQRQLRVTYRRVMNRPTTVPAAPGE